MHGLIAHVSAVAAAAATGTPAPVDNDIDTESAKSGPLGLVVIILLCVACYFLFKSLSKHLRSVREGTLGEGEQPVDQAGSAGSLAVEDAPAVLDASADVELAEHPASQAAPPPA